MKSKLIQALYSSCISKQTSLHITFSCQRLWWVFTRGKNGGEVKPSCASLLALGCIRSLKTRTAKMASSSFWVRDTVCALDELPVSLCHRYRVSPAQPHTGSESHLFTSHLQVADSSSPRVTGRGGGQISFWNFNLLQLNYLISEPHTSKEYLSSLLPGCLDGGFHSCLLKDSLISYLYPAVWMTLCRNL